MGLSAQILALVRYSGPLQEVRMVTNNTREMCQRLAARLDELATGDSERASFARSYVDTVWVEHMQRLERLVVALETRFPEVRKVEQVSTVHANDGARRVGATTQDETLRVRMTPSKSRHCDVDTTGQGRLF